LPFYCEIICGISENEVIFNKNYRKKDVEILIDIDYQKSFHKDCYNELKESTDLFLINFISCPV